MAASELSIPDDSNAQSKSSQSRPKVKNDDTESKDEKKENKDGMYNLDESWTQDIEDEYNPESFVKEYPNLKKLLQTFNLNPIDYTASIISMVCIRWIDSHSFNKW